MTARIVQLDAWPVDVPLEKPFGIAGGAQDVAHNVFVRVRLAEGVVGYGEAAPFPAFNGETQEGTLAAIERARGSIVGCDARRWVDGWMGAEQGEAAGIGVSGAALCALEMALADAVDRQQGRRLFGAPPGELRTDVTIPIGPIDACAADARIWAARGFSRLKVKVGGAGPEDALARTFAVHEAAPEAEIMLDGNAGLSASDAVTVLRALRGRSIRPFLFEQPCAKDDIDGLFEVAAASDVPVALDESVSAVAQLARFTSHPGFDPSMFVVNVKPMKAGFGEALRIARHARTRAGMRLMIGGMVETRMAMSASACFVLGLRPAIDFDFVDLDTPLFLAGDPVDGGYAQQGDRIDVSPIASGHGAVPREQP
jgi:L-alanine-DL-glutamate epimerase-like enolase superfamily enzyme